MKKIIGADMLHIADLMDNLGDQILAVSNLMSNSSNEDILIISPLVTSLAEKMAITKDEFLGYIGKAEAKE